MDADEVLDVIRQELQALKFLVMATIINTATAGSSIDGGQKYVDSIKQAALAGVDNSTFSDASTAEAWKGNMKAEIEKLCTSINFISTR